MSKTIVVSDIHDDELERLTLAYSKQFQAILHTARQQIRAGEGLSHDDFWQGVNQECNDEATA